MHWVAPSEQDTASATLEQHLWDAADQFRANSGLKSQEYSAGSPQGPVLGLILQRLAEARFAAKRAQLESPSTLEGERVGVRGDSGHPCVLDEGAQLARELETTIASNVS